MVILRIGRAVEAHLGKTKIAVTIVPRPAERDLAPQIDDEVEEEEEEIADALEVPIDGDLITNILVLVLEIVVEEDAREVLVEEERDLLSEDLPEGEEIRDLLLIDVESLDPH